MIKYDPLNLSYISYHTLEKIEPTINAEFDNNQLCVKNAYTIAIMLSHMYSFHTDLYQNLYVLNDDYTLFPIKDNSPEFLFLLDSLNYRYSIRYDISVKSEDVIYYLKQLPNVLSSVIINPVCLNYNPNITPVFIDDLDITLDLLSLILGDSVTTTPSSIFLSQCAKVVYNHYNGLKSPTIFTFVGGGNSQSILWLLSVFEKYNFEISTVYDKCSYLEELSSSQSFIKIVYIPYNDISEVIEWANHPLTFDFSNRLYQGCSKVSSSQEMENVLLRFFYLIYSVVIDIQWTDAELRDYIFCDLSRIDDLGDYSLKFSKLFKSKLESGLSANNNIKNLPIWSISEVKKSDDDDGYDKKPMAIKDSFEVYPLYGAYDTYDRSKKLSNYYKVSTFFSLDDSFVENYRYAVNLNKETPIVVLDVDGGQLSSTNYPFDVAVANSLSGVGQHFYFKTSPLTTSNLLKPYLSKNLSVPINDKEFELFSQKKFITLSNPDSLLSMSARRFYWLDYIYREMIHFKYNNVMRKFDKSSPKWHPASAFAKIQKYADKKGLTFNKGSRHNDAMVLFGYCSKMNIDYDLLIEWVLEHVPDWPDAKKELEASKNSFLRNN